MNRKDQFFLLVNQAFTFLEDEFGFKKQSNNETRRTSFVDYWKGELITRVLYSFANDYIEIAIYNQVSKVPPGQYDWKYSVTLMHLLRRSLPGFDYESIMAKKISMEESVCKLAQLLKEHAAAILEEKEWISWGEITGFNQRVPNDLP
jgi:hypothetical protein